MTPPLKALKLQVVSRQFVLAREESLWQKFLLKMSSDARCWSSGAELACQSLGGIYERDAIDCRRAAVSSKFRRRLKVDKSAHMVYGTRFCELEAAEILEIT